MKHIFKKGDIMSKQLIGKELRSLNNLINRYVDNYTKKKHFESITGTNLWVIGYLDENSDKDIYQKDLENEFSITRSTASKVLTLMVKKGLIERKSVPHDARLKKLVLTSKALEFTKEMRKDMMKVEENLTKGFSSEEIEELHTYIERLKANVL